MGAPLVFFTRSWWDTCLRLLAGMSRALARRLADHSLLLGRGLLAACERPVPVGHLAGRILRGSRLAQLLGDLGDLLWGQRWRVATTARESTRSGSRGTLGVFRAAARSTGAHGVL